MEKQYIIQGPMVEEETLYWSNDLGWVDMASATRFGPEVLFFPLPLEGVAILELDDKGNVTNCYLRGTGGGGSNKGH
jgi:hypothetical protein